MQQEQADDFVLATGETHDVKEFVNKTAEVLDIEITWQGRGLEEKGIDKKSSKIIIEIDPKYFRPSEVPILLGDYTKAKNKLGWEPKVKFNELVKIMAEADYDAEAKKLK